MTPSLTAREIIGLIQKSSGVPLRDQTVDTFKFGAPDAPVRGVAVTMMPTLAVLQNAVQVGANLVIAHEPLFWNHSDETEDFERENDAIWAAKRAFLEEHQLIVWRYHDLPHWQKPDAILAGMTRELGWEAFANPGHPALFSLPTTTLQTLAQFLAQRLEAPTLRVVGAPDLPVSRVALSPGCPGFGAHRQLFTHSDVEVLIIGEAREWETVPYVADAVALGQLKALIILGHIASEQGGMRFCAEKLQTLLPVLPVHFLPTPEPFWSPR